MHQGLSSSEVKKRQEKYGLNILAATNPNPWWKMLLHQFTDLMVIILIVSAAIAVGFGWYEGHEEGYIDGFVIFGIVLLNAAIGFFQEYRSEKALEALKKLIDPQAIVIRDGKKTSIKAEDVVPDDIVVLTAGDKIVADGVILEAMELKIDESALTGESVPVSKNGEEELFMGTTVVAGNGLMKVVNTGMNTSFGRIAHLTTTTVKDKSPLQKEMFHIGVFVTKVTLVISAILIFAGVMVQGKTFLESLLFAVSVAVAAVPEGLPATITVALALGVQKMVKKQAVVKRLSSIETLGSTTVICSDKTGTLTRNEMTVTRVLLGSDQLLQVAGSGYDPDKGAIELGNNKAKDIQLSNLEKMRLISLHCSEADLQLEKGQYRVLGDPTEGALLTLAQKKLEGDRKKPQLPDTEVMDMIPFDSTRKMMSVMTKGKELWTKGSPDELLKRCPQILINGKVKPFTVQMKKDVQHYYEQMARDALRVIGFAYKPLKSLPKATNGRDKALKKLEDKLIFVGLAGMIDPPREEVPAAVKMCHTAGIRTIIVTGDYGITAKAIAKDIGIATNKTPVVLGEELETMSDKQLDKLLKLERKKGKLPSLHEQSLIFSRVNPEHKRRIVDRLKHQWEVVAVTGDGVNDAPALKRADLGIAMGITGTEVSKETANMILLDDSFASIVTAVREGRKIYNNLRKFTWFIFSCNIGELVTVFSAIIFQIPAPLTASLILAIDLGTDILPGIALGVDHAEPNVMERPPRNPKGRIMNKGYVLHFLGLGLFIGAIVVGLYWWQLTQMGWSYAAGLDIAPEAQRKASTLAFAALVVIQLFNAFNARSFEHSVFKLRSLWQLWGSIVVSVILVLALVYLPFFQRIFRTTALTTHEWGLVIGAGVVVLLVEEIRKLVKRSI